MRKRNILSATSFVIILIALLLGASEFFIKFNYKSTILANEPENSMDYLVIGDSEAYTSISPVLLYSEFGYTGYNIGKARHNLQETYYSLVEALKDQQPKYVFMEVDTAFRNGKIFKNIETFLTYGLESFFSITAQHNDWKKIIENGFKVSEATPEEFSTTNYSKGFMVRKDSKPFKGKAYMNPSDEYEEVPEYHEEYFQKIIDKCEEENIKLVLYSSVTPINWTYKKHNTIQAIADKNGLMYFDLNVNPQKLGIDIQRHSYDGGDHVNYDAAKLITSYFGTYLNKEGRLADKRDDATYEYWNVTLSNYLNTNGR